MTTVYTMTVSSWTRSITTWTTSNADSAGSRKRQSPTLCCVPANVQGQLDTFIFFVWKCGWIQRLFQKVLEIQLLSLGN